jgi:hypothetical protein
VGGQPKARPWAPESGVGLHIKSESSLAFPLSLQGKHPCHLVLAGSVSAEHATVRELYPLLGSKPSFDIKSALQLKWPQL